MEHHLVFLTREIKEKGGLLYSERGPFEPVLQAELSGINTQDCKVDLEFSVGGNHILLEGRIETRYQAACSRCLVEGALPLQATVEETFPLTQESIDLTEDVRQALILSAPAKPLCRPDCRGLCSECGQNLNDTSCKHTVKRKTESDNAKPKT